MEDERLMFRPDGTGWREYTRPWHSDRTLFHWGLAGSGLIRVEAHLRIVTDERDGRPESEEHAMNRIETGRYAVTVVERPMLEQPVRELSVEMSLALDSPFAFVGAGEPGTNAQATPG
jgi:hypothetical protein